MGAQSWKLTDQGKKEIGKENCRILASDREGEDVVLVNNTLVGAPFHPAGSASGRRIWKSKVSLREMASSSLDALAAETIEPPS